MYYELIELKWITERGNVALIKRGDKHKEYAVVRNLDTSEPFESDCQWDNTIEYYSADIVGLQRAVDCFRRKCEYNYISRLRLEELATQFKDGLVEAYGDDPETSEVIEDLIETYALSDYEVEFFGLKESED
jgi:hypothetical protein